LLITSLPQKFETEQEQLETIQQLSEQHQLAGKRLDQAREEASNHSFIAFLMYNLRDS
jgi:hypothetical protein